MFQRGQTVRREVLGDAYVDRATANADPFNQPLQELVTEFCWGWLWARTGLARQTRSLLNIAMLSVLNRRNELKTHVLAALRGGCTKEEIQEVLLQATVYGGIPCGVDSFAIAREAFAEYEVTP